MITVVQTVDAGAGEFDGTADKGLIIFENELPLPQDSPDLVPILTNVALQGDDSTTITTIKCYLDSGGDSTAILPIRMLLTTPETGFTNLGCRIPVPRGSTTAWQLKCITTGKTIKASLIASFELGQAVTD